MKCIFYLGKISLILFITNSAFADNVSDARLDCYKGNNIISREFQSASLNASISATDSVVFNENALSWTLASDLQSAIFSKYSDWTKDDFVNFFSDYTNSDEFESAWNFLSFVGNQKIDESKISSTDALGLLQNQLDTMLLDGTLRGQAFPCEGLDFTNRVLAHLDLSNCTGLTGEQLASTESISNTDIPPVDFTGIDISKTQFSNIGGFSNVTGLTWEQVSSALPLSWMQLPALDLTGVDLSKKSLYGLSLVNCTGLSPQQVLSAANLTWASLPTLDFAGIDFTGKDLSGVDFSMCTGLTDTQLSAASSIDYITLSQQQYDTLKSTLPEGIYIYVGDKEIVVKH